MRYPTHLTLVSEGQTANLSLLCGQGDRIECGAVVGLVSDGQCEDNSSDCRYCAGRCSRDSAVTLVAKPSVETDVKMSFCEYCAEDALESGLFTIVGE